MSAEWHTLHQIQVAVSWCFGSVGVHRPGGLLAHPQPCGEEHAQGGGRRWNCHGKGASWAGSQRNAQGPHRHQGEVILFLMKYELPDVRVSVAWDMSNSAVVFGCYGAFGAAWQKQLDFHLFWNNSNNYLLLFIWQTLFFSSYWLYITL